MNNYRKITRRKNKRKNKSRKLRFNKFRKRQQIGCSRRKYMKGGGISPIQSVLDVMNNVTHTGSGLWNQYTGESAPLQSPNPTSQP